MLNSLIILFNINVLWVWILFYFILFCKLFWDWNGTRNAYFSWMVFSQFRLPVAAVQASAANSATAFSRHHFSRSFPMQCGHLIAAVWRGTEGAQITTPLFVRAGLISITPSEPKDYKREKKKKEWGIAKDRDWWVSLAIKAEKGGPIAFSVENGGLIPTESPYNGQHHWVFRVMHTWAWEWSHTVQGFAAQTASVTSTSMHGGESGGRMGWGEVGTNK